jgi:hypothetical protein
MSVQSENHVEACSPPYVSGHHQLRRAISILQFFTITTQILSAGA